MESVFESMSQKRKSSGALKDAVKKSRSMDDFVRKPDSLMDDIKECVKLVDGWMPGAQMQLWGKFLVFHLGWFLQKKPTQNILIDMWGY